MSSPPFINWRKHYPIAGKTSQTIYIFQLHITCLSCTWNEGTDSLPSQPTLQDQTQCNAIHVTRLKLNETFCQYWLKSILVVSRCYVMLTKTENRFSNIGFVLSFRLAVSWSAISILEEGKRIPIFLKIKCSKVCNDCCKAGGWVTRLFIQLFQCYDW